MEILLCNSLDDAVVAYVTKKWNEMSDINLGRTIIQKICYFLKAKGIPLDFTFDMYHYGPFCQDLYYKMDILKVDSIIWDKSNDESKSKYIPGPMIDTMINDFQEQIDEIKADIDEVIEIFSDLNPGEMELLATIHYFQTSLSRYYKEPPTKEAVILAVKNTKGDKFNDESISKSYDALSEVGLFNWQS